jgi:hypothetical protein
MINRLTSFLLFFTITSSFSFNNEIKGKFVYDTDINKNELYLFNNLLELKTYDLETSLLKYSRQITLNNQEQLNNRTWSGLYTGDVNLNPDAMNGIMNNLKLKRLKNGKFYLFHDGGGLVLNLENDKLNRIDNSFPFMNKFFGDFINYNDKIFHFGGYGLFRSNNTMLLFNEANSNQWDEVKFENNIPSELKSGIASFFPLLIDANYYILSGNSSFNNERIFNKSILKFDFENYTWDKLGEINLDLSENPLIIPSETCFYIFDKDFFYQVQILKEKMLKFDYNRDFNVESLGNSDPYNRSDQSFLSINKKGEEFGIISMNNYDNKFIHTFKPHNGKPNTSMLNKYKLDQIIDVDSVKEIPLYKVEQSRNQFFIPMLIVLVIIIINLLHKGIKKDVKEVNKKLYTIGEDELFFLGTKINIDNNALEILKMLQENEQITSNDIVAKLVDNGLSYDYSSKVKNKIIESLNEKFEFITGSNETFINISKSPQDKRIQILSLIKS